MTDQERLEELERRVAALTERIYQLETRDRFDPLQSLKKALARPFYPPDRAVTAGSLESKIGGHWLNRLGIIAVLFGVSYFLKYAFDNAWIGPAGRVVTGLIAGSGIVAWSEYIRRSGYAAFSYSLKAAGIGVLYLSLWASSQLYGLAPAALAFIAMAAVTASTATLALVQNASVIAVFAMIGGFLTPLALSSGENNAVSLFSYIATLNAGILGILRYKPWHRLGLGAYAGTAVLYATWHIRHFSPDQTGIAAGFTTLFFAGFAAIPWIVRERAAAPSLMFLTIINAATYLLQTYELLDHAGSVSATAIAAVALACVYFVAAYQMAVGRPPVVSGVHWAVGAGLLVAAVPIGLDAHWITIGWFVEAGALLWVAERTRNAFLKNLGIAALVLGTVRLVAVDNFQVEQFLVNYRVATFAVAIAVLAAVAVHAGRSRQTFESLAAPALVVVIHALALFALNQEIADAYRRYVIAADWADVRMAGIIRDFSYSAVWMAYGAALMAAGFWKASRFLRWQALILMAVSIVKVFLYDTSSLDTVYRIASFTILGIILLTTSFLYQRKKAAG